MFTLRSPLQLPNLVGPQTNHKPADCGTVKFICKNTSHLIRGQSKENTSCYFFTALMLIVRTLLKGFSRYRLLYLKSHRTTMDPIVSYCGGASIVWNPISLSASPGSRHDLKVMPTLRLQLQDKVIPAYAYVPPFAYGQSSYYFIVCKL